MIKFESEAALEQFLIDNTHTIQEKLEIVGKPIQQMDIGAHGRPDIVFVDYDDGTDLVTPILYVTMVELKNTSMTYDNLGQLAKYRNFFGRLDQFGVHLDLRSILIAPKTLHDSGNLCYLAQSCSEYEVYEFVLDVNCGIQFELVQGWKPAAFKQSFLESVHKKLTGDIDEP